MAGSAVMQLVVRAWLIGLLRGLLRPPSSGEACQQGEHLGVVKIRVGAKSATLDFGPQPKLEPIKLIKLIQSQPKVYKLEGQKRLNIIAKEFEDPKARQPGLSALLARLAA